MRCPSNTGSATSRSISNEGEKSMLDFLQVVDPTFKTAKIDLSKTFDPHFVAVSAETVK